mgnify:FL=1
MAKFNVPDPNDDEAPVKPSMDEIRAMNDLPPVPKPVTVNPNASSSVPQQPIPVMVIGQNQPSMGSAMVSQQTVQTQSMAATAQAQASVGLAQTSIDQQVVNEQIKKEEEHWMKAYWRPAMGWLYMCICFCDFIFFPLLTMFLPVIEKGFGVNINYTPWQSLSLSNGGLMHLAFGAILGVSAWTRGQEKIAKI